MAGRRSRSRDGSRSAYRSEEHTSELQSQSNLVCRLLLEKKNNRARSNHVVCPETVVWCTPQGDDAQDLSVLRRVVAAADYWIRGACDSTQSSVLVCTTI